jgi:hypothetical protein
MSPFMEKAFSCFERWANGSTPLNVTFHKGDLQLSLRGTITQLDSSQLKIEGEAGNFSILIAELQKGNAQVFGPGELPEIKFTPEERYLAVRIDLPSGSRLDIVESAADSGGNALPNNGMHPTADTLALI